jgi:4-hydroxybenzoate polyprenyltransferase
MAAICLPFDSRDIEIDKKENIQTFAVLFGSRRVNLIAIIFAIFYLFLIIMSGANSIQFTINLIVFLTCFVFILKNNNPRNEYFYIAGIDGILILKGILCCFLI